MPKTLFDKIWDAHEVTPGLIYIDLHHVAAPDRCGGRSTGPSRRATSSRSATAAAASTAAGW